MPQFNPAFFSPQLFWLAVTFIALYVVMAMFCMPRIDAVLEERQRRIDDNLAKAAKLKAEAEKIAALYEEALAQSRAQAAKLLSENAEKLAQEAEKRQKELGGRLNENVKAGEARIAAAKTQALADIRTIAVEAAKTASLKLTGFALDDAKIAGAIASVIEERR